MAGYEPGEWVDSHQGRLSQLSGRFPDASKGEANPALARKLIASASYWMQLSPLQGSQKSHSQLCSEAPKRDLDSPNGDASPQQRLKLTVADEQTP